MEALIHNLFLYEPETITIRFFDPHLSKHVTMDKYKEIGKRIQDVNLLVVLEYLTRKLRPSLRYTWRSFSKF
jgi:hypothetical protein